MDTDAKIFVYAGLIVLAIVMTIAGSCSYNNSTDDKAIADMVAKGADPITAGCAINMNNNTNGGNHISLCMSAASRSK